MSTFTEEFLDNQIGMVPNNINRYLRMIRLLDKRVDKLGHSLGQQQTNYLAHVREAKDKHNAELTNKLKEELQGIREKQRQLYGYAKEKKEISQIMFEEIQEYYLALKNQVDKRSKRMGENGIEPIRQKKIRNDEERMLNAPKKAPQFLYDEKEGSFCYCGRTSFGQMVACENLFCEREWFHVDCLEEKNLPDKWYCVECQKQKDKTKNLVSRSYFVSKTN